MTSMALVTGQETARIAKLQDQKVHASIGIGAGRMGRVGVKGQIPSPSGQRFTSAPMPVLDMPVGECGGRIP
jgi:hypothetical protein